MNLAIRGLDANLGPHNADSFTNDLHKDVRADFILANPPFNLSRWGDETCRSPHDVRWQHGTPPAGNANFAWMQHMIHHLSPRGVAGIVLANGSMSSNTSGEGGIRQKIVEADLVDCMVAMPGQLFYIVQIPVCLWFLARDKRDSGKRDRRGETLFIDARKMGHLIDRVHRDLSDDDIQLIARTYHAWRGEPEAGEYEDVPGFCKGARTEEIAGHGFVLTPGRYVGAADVDDDDEPFEERMARLTATLKNQFMESSSLQSEIEASLAVPGDV
jgi:type I restriction enzyme M protein